MAQQAMWSRPATYQIQVGGRLEDSCSAWFDGMRVGIGARADGLIVTTLTGRLDQSALHGVLRRIRDLGLPLLQVEQLPEL